MKAADIEGPHPEWRSYYTGPSDREGLLEIRGLGPARVDLILRLYGSIDTFLVADPEDVAEQSRYMIGPTLARKIQRRCKAAELHSDWSRLMAQVEEDDLIRDQQTTGNQILTSVRRRWSSVGRWTRKLWISTAALTRIRSQ